MIFSQYGNPFHCEQSHIQCDLHNYCGFTAFEDSLMDLEKSKEEENLK